jgi:hypothetical protein
MTEATQPSWIFEPPKDHSINTLRIKHKKNNKIIKKRFDKFIQQNSKDFCDDIWGVIKSYMIDPKYTKSSFYEENSEVKVGRYIECESCGTYNTPYTSVLIGKRYGNLLQVALHKEEDVLFEETNFTMIKTHMNVGRYGELYEDTHELLTGVWEYDDDDEFEEGEEYFDEEYEIMRRYKPRPYQNHYHIPSGLKIKRLT